MYTIIEYHTEYMYNNTKPYTKTKFKYYENDNTWENVVMPLLTECGYDAKYFDMTKARLMEKGWIRYTRKTDMYVYNGIIIYKENGCSQ